MLQNHIKYSQKPPRTFTGKTCSPLLCYRFVSTTLAAQIPSGNAIANSLGLLHAETGFSYLGAGHYDSDILTGWIFNGFNSIDRANYRAKCERVNQAIQDAGHQSINK